LYSKTNTIETILRKNEKNLEYLNTLIFTINISTFTFYWPKV